MSQKYILCGLRDLRGSKYKKPINAIYEYFVNSHQDFPPKPVRSGFNLIPHCIAMGEAAGTAAALAVRAGIKPREVEYRALQRNLVGRGVLLPKEITELL